MREDLQLASHSSETRDKKATFMMRTSLHKRLKRKAVTQDRKMSELIDDALEMYLKIFGG